MRLKWHIIDENQTEIKQIEEKEKKEKKLKKVKSIELNGKWN